MKISILVQARMNATRLPGKMMIQVGGKPILQHVVERLRLANTVKSVVVLTSREAQDDAIAEWCRYHSVEFFRGPLQDVLGRFAEAVEFYQLDAFIRICADSPFIDPAIVDELVHVYKTGHYDLVTNLIPRTFPKGQSVEVINARFFTRFAGRITATEDREHVTSYFYRNPLVGSFKNVPNPLGNLSNKSLCIDTVEDLERFKKAVEYFEGRAQTPSWIDCLAAMDLKEARPR